MFKLLEKAFGIHKTVRNPVIEIFDGFLISPEEIETSRITITAIGGVAPGKAIGIGVVFLAGKLADELRVVLIKCLNPECALVFDDLVIEYQMVSALVFQGFILIQIPVIRVLVKLPGGQGNLTVPAGFIGE